MVAFLNVIISSFAYFRDYGTAENYLKAKSLKVELIDVFDNGNLTLPGDSMNKDVSMRNNGEIDAVVRIQLVPTWAPETDAEGNSLDQSEVDVVLGESADTDWVKIGDWYYYNKVLAPGETTTLLVDKLYLNPVSNDHHMANYSEAVFTLKVNAESLQAISNAAVDNWQISYTTNEEGIDWIDSTMGGSIQ